jgi:myo-inositol catabolism protein IolH
MRTISHWPVPRDSAVELGFQHVELSPREDFLPFFLHPRADRASIGAFKKALAGAGVSVASVLPLYRWSGPDEDERQAAVRYWKRAIQVTVELGCQVMNSEFNGRPEAAAASEARFWRSMDELLPVFEREDLQLRLEPHPDDFVEDGRAVVELIRGIDNDVVSFLYCAPHTFHQGGDIAGIMRYAGPLLTHLHIADSFDHRASSGLRYIVNPPGSPAGVHVRQQGRHHGPIPADFRERFGGAYQSELQKWVTGVLSGEVAGPSAWDGYATTAVAESCVQALTQGRRTVVELADRPALYA